MENKSFAYIRVSSKEQNIDRQVHELKKYVTDERAIFVDKLSGNTFERPAYQSLKYQVRKSDIIYVKSLDRFGRNKDEIKNELKWYKDKGVFVKILDVPTTMLDFSQFGSLQKAIIDMVDNILIEVLGTFAEQERKMIKERQSEGIKLAKEKGIKFGRPPVVYPENWNDYYNRWKDGKITAVQFMRENNLKSTTFYSLMKKYEKNTN